MPPTNDNHMITNDLILNPGSWGGTSANLTYVLAGYPTSTSSIRRVQATALSEPNSLTVSHRSIVRGGLTINQHLLRHDRLLIDPLKGAVKGAVWISCEVPLGTTVFTQAVVKDMIGRLPSAFLQAGFTDAWLAGES